MNLNPLCRTILVAGAALIALLLDPSRALAAAPTTQEDAELRRAVELLAEQAPVVLTAKVESVKAADAGEGALEVKLAEPAMLKGDRPEKLTLPYRVAAGQGFAPEAGQEIVAVISRVLTGPIIGGPPTLPGRAPPMPGAEWRIVAAAPATAENVAAAKRGIARSPEGKLVAAVQGAELVFTATVAKVSVVPGVKPMLLQVIVADLTMLKGEKPAALDCPYPLPPAAPALFRPWGGEKVLIAAHPAPKDAAAGLGGSGPRIFFMTNASDPNVALARQALAGPASKPATTKP